MSDQLTLDLPKLSFPYFWTIDVTSGYLYVKIQKRTWWWPTRYGHIESTEQESIKHKGLLHQGLLDEVAARAAEMALQVDPQRDVKRQLHKVRFTNAKARVRKY